MKYVSNKSASQKSVLTMLVLGAMLLVGVSLVRSNIVSASSSVAGKSNILRNVVASVSGMFQTIEPEQEPNESIDTANPIQLPGRKTGTVKLGDAATYEFSYNNGPKDKIEDFFASSLWQAKKRKKIYT